MNLGFESSLHLACGPRERDPGAAASLPGHGETLPLEPGHDLVQVVLAQPKLAGELLRRQPVVEARRKGVLQIVQKGRQLRLAGSR